MARWAGGRVVDRPGPQGDALGWKNQGPSAQLQPRPNGFSLLEVILALGILSGSLAVLGEVARNASRNAIYARDISVAQLLCETKMAEITSGVELPVAVAGEPFDVTDDESLPDWLFSVEVNTIDQETGLTAVCVTVQKDAAEEKRPARFSLVRWIVDSSAAATTTVTETASE